MKTKITTLATELDVSVNELMRLKVKLDPAEWKGVGKNCWFTPEGVEKIRLALEIPLAVPNQLQGKVLRSARNPNWVYAKLMGIDGAHPVAIPRRLRDKLRKKQALLRQLEEKVALKEN